MTQLAALSPDETKAKYTIDIEGKDYPWDADTITVPQIRELGGIPADQEVQEIDLKDNSEHTLAESAVVVLEPGKAFSKKVRFQRG
jgi:hypothetical protein